MAAKKPNWGAIKAEYLRGGTSYRKLAEKWGVNASTLEKRAKRESWADGLRQTSEKIAAELPGKVAEAVISEVTAITRRSFELWEKMLTKAETMLEAEHEYVARDKKGEPILHPETEEPILELHQQVGGPKDLKDWAAAVKMGTEGQRLAMGLDKKESNPADDRDFDGSLWEGLEDDERGPGS